MKVQSYFNVLSKVGPNSPYPLLHKQLCFYLNNQMR